MLGVRTSLLPLTPSIQEGRPSARISKTFGRSCGRSLRARTGAARPPKITDLRVKCIEGNLHDDTRAFGGLLRAPGAPARWKGHAKRVRFCCWTIPAFAKIELTFGSL